ncbi:hypothetical protein LguiA_025426 [Lonicera macranthoides]
MDGVGRRKSLKERLGLKGMSCCGGATWGLTPSTINVRDDEDSDEGPLHQHQHQQQHQLDVGRTPLENISDPVCVGHTPSASGMNLATALAAERQFRAGHDSDGSDSLSPSPSPSPIRPNNNGPVPSPGTPLRVSLLRLLEESDGHGVDGEEMEKGGGGGGVGCGTLCCVCMGRKKGAAFIPCGHTFCRVCSRELWLNRGSCPLCNRPILEILDIF